MTFLRITIFWLLAALFAQAQPARIVSTFPSITEILFALGVGDHVVGVSNYCRYPPAVLSLPKIGTYTKPDPERIALLRPDLVIIQDAATSLADRLRALNIRYVTVKVGSLDDIYLMVTNIGQAAGVADRATKLNNDIRSRLSAVQEQTRNEPKPSVLMIVGKDPGLLTNLIAVGPGAYLGELLEVAGGKNVLTQSLMAYPHISLETVVRLNPDVILDFSMMGDAGADAVAQEMRLRQPWMSHSELSAVHSGMVFGLTSETLVTPGPRVVDAVDLIRSKIRQRKSGH